MRGEGLRAKALSHAGLAPMEVTADGSFANDRAAGSKCAKARGPQGFSVDANGRVPLNDGQMAVDVNLNAFPLAALNSVAPGQGLAGTVTGTARVTGTRATQPHVQPPRRGPARRAARGAGLAPLELTADGSFADKVLTLMPRRPGPAGLSLSASGTVPLPGGG